LDKYSALHHKSKSLQRKLDDTLLKLIASESARSSWKWKFELLHEKHNTLRLRKNEMARKRYRLKLQKEKDTAIAYFQQQRQASEEFHREADEELQGWSEHHLLRDGTVDDDDAYDELESGRVLASATESRDMLMEDRKPMKQCFDLWKQSRRSHEAASSSAAAADAHEVTSSSGTGVDEPLTHEEIRLLHEQVDDEDDEMQRLNEEVMSAPIHVRFFCGPLPQDHEATMNFAKRARVEIAECRAMPGDLPQIAQIFAMHEWNPVQFLEGITVEQERAYLTSMEARRTIENTIDQTVAILPNIAEMKNELNHLNKRVNAAEAYLRSLVSTKLDGMEKGAWIGMVRLHLQERV
jgi:hypothetical protein